MQWELENSLVMVWLINSIVPSVAQGMSFFESAQKIWEAAVQTYSQQDNTTQAFELKRKMRVLRQGELSVTTYMVELQHLWSELDFYCPFKASCANDAAEFKKFTDEEWIFVFLTDLNEKFDPIRVQILDRSSDLPSLNQIFSLILSKKTHRRVMIASYADTVDRKSVV